MNRKVPRIVVALATLMLIAIGLSADQSSAEAASSMDVEGVQFRWGINDESNNRAFNPGTFNLLSAGKLGDPGEGGQLLTDTSQGATWSNGQPAGWTARDGNVLIEKRQSDGTYALATWAGTKTDRDGVALGFPPGSNTKFSDHQVVINEGVGTIDPSADDADITWDGDVTVIYYSGMTFFSITDPHLVISDGTGIVTATLSGYGSDINDTDLWETVPPADVTIATLDDVDVTPDGLVTLPAYAGVDYDCPPAGTTQVCSGDHWGSFPVDFVDFQTLTGQSSYWYSSGGVVDKNKPALPVTVLIDPEPGIVKATPTVGVASTSSTYGRSAKVTVTVSPPEGPQVTGNAILSGAGAALSKALSGGKAVFTLPATLTPKAYTLTAAYSGNELLNAAQGKETHTVARAGVTKPTLKVTKKPTATNKGKATVAVRSKVKGVQTTGKVTVTLAKAATKKTTSTTLKDSKGVVALPKLPKGTWKVTIAYKGSLTHLGATAKAGTIRSA
jgi:hypothetical protein